ncbi:hypothetical protein PM082_024939 [Marasmius tenuissimus]|nr:hypothetical protein PM082_024939 [Marasmius tenuissimus]
MPSQRLRQNLPFRRQTFWARHPYSHTPPLASPFHVCSAPSSTPTTASRTIIPANTVIRAEASKLVSALALKNAGWAALSFDALPAQPPVASCFLPSRPIGHSSSTSITDDFHSYTPSLMQAVAMFDDRRMASKLFASQNDGCVEDIG